MSSVENSTELDQAIVEKQKRQFLVNDFDEIRFRIGGPREAVNRLTKDFENGGVSQEVHPNTRNALLEAIYASRELTSDLEGLFEVLDVEIVQE